MRTREYQTLELAVRLAYPLHYDDGHLREAEDMILEAERRAERRVRAECAADTRRLEWLAKHACYYNIAPENQGIPDWKDLSETDFRAAIDAAMEGGK